MHEELYYRIAGEVLVLPPLAERPEDIETLALHFAQHATLTQGALIRLHAHDWPGDVRELELVIARAKRRSSTIEADDISACFDPTPTKS
ncbi:hypothetical protein [Plesiocystis pacifica]|uniref:hypothetical protein n=1 Tax=Plesiocystis pacifica TaxID=191768 RepID=UPI001E486557|nr:hypothetical protein [Plesiocystis pacifica]